ncbi:arginine repressor [Sphingomonas sp.]|jgi:transcriptional regulator of arginine metabolism|uniref:arginine repressor n=1 Tax=Sphingomonas sp. TaxID=28214 RepID=UPI002FC84462
MIETFGTGTPSRARRQKAISELIRGQPIASQEEVTEKLASLGFAVTQATVSRDLEQLGAVKVKRGGVLGYALPEQFAESDWSADRLARILSEWVISAEAAGNIIVLKTPPGSAHLVGSAIDHAAPPEVAGTVSGDDTLFLVVRDGYPMGVVLHRFRALAGQE